jgi:hypothetical protein
MMAFQRTATDYNDAWLVVADSKSYISKFKLDLLPWSKVETQYYDLASLNEAKVGGCNTISIWLWLVIVKQT